jgi:hypothetical protein
MPPREFKISSDKRDELKTYRELELGRGLKSARQRKRLEASGTQRVIGDGSSSRPYLLVEARRYREVRLEVQRRLLIQARQTGLNLPVDLLMRQLRPRIEGMTYAQLADERDHAVAQNLPVAALGRALTTEERAHFAASHAASDVIPRREASRGTRVALNQVLGSIEQRQSHNPARYQTIWAQLVGPDAAQQSQLESVDAATQTAFFRCVNSVLSADLRRRPGLAQKLSRALGVPVRQIRSRF